MTGPKFLSGVNGVLPFDDIPADLGVSLSVPAGTAATYATLYTVPAGTYAVIRNVYLYLDPTAGANQSFVGIYITRGGISRIIVGRIYSVPTNNVHETIPCEIGLQAGDIIEWRYANTDGSARLITAYLIIDTVPG